MRLFIASGCCVLSKKILGILFLGSSVAMAQGTVPPSEPAKPPVTAAAAKGPAKGPVKVQAVKVVIKAEQAYIFDQPNFDSQVSTVLGPSPKVYLVSRQKWGPFHKIQMAPGKLGYILDSDIQVAKPSAKGGKAATKKQAQKKAKDKKEADKADGKRLPFQRQPYLGPAVQIVNFSEDTMGSLRTQSLTFLGARWSGPSRLLEGAMYTDSSFLVSWGAPGYYSSATGNSATGWILLADLLVQMTQTHSKDTYSYYGIGPMFRYSHIAATLTQGDIKTDYALDDMVAGAVLDLGIATRFSGYALRFDGKYYWERKSYWALSLAFQFEF